MQGRAVADISQRRYQSPPGCFVMLLEEGLLPQQVSAILFAFAAISPQHFEIVTGELK
jgi:hypothetical protein